MVLLALLWFLPGVPLELWSGQYLGGLPPSLACSEAWKEKQLKDGGQSQV